MKSCPSCAAPAEDAARFCLECGHAFAAEVDAGDPWEGRVIAGRYRLVRKLGAGGMGEVYLAEQIAMGRRVAVKLLRAGLADDTEQVERFKREAHAASRLTHPNTIILHDFGVDDDGTLFLAMELLEGESLAEVLARTPRLPPERAVAILAQVCGSLEEAHSRGVIHRDLKPENIFLTRRGGHDDYVKVLDFGIAKIRSTDAEQSLDTLTRDGVIFGTPQYMSPEQIRGEDLDARSDVYALGVMLYQMLSGHLPFRAGTAVEMLTKHLTATPAPFGEVDAGDRAALARLEAVARRALAKDPAQRQPSARAFLEDLMAALPQLPTAPMTGLVPATPDGAPVPGGAGAPVATAVRPALFATFALAALTVVAAAFWLRPGGGDPGRGSSTLPAVMGADADETDDGEAAEVAEGGEGGAEAAAEGGEQAGDEAAAEGGDEAAAAEGGDEAAAEGGDEAAAADAAAEAEAKALEEEEAPANEAEAEAKAAELEEEKKAAEAEQKAAEAEARAKAAAEAAKKAEAERKAAEAAKAAAEAEKAAAKAAQAEAQARAAKAAAEKSAAETAAAEARRQAEAAKKAAESAKTEAERLRAELERLAAEKAEAEARAAEAEAKIEEAKAKAEAVRKRRKAATAAFGRLSVSSSRRGARVYIDGKLRGTTPLSGVRIKPGRHVVEVRDGSKRRRQSIVVKPNGVHRVRISF